MVPDFPSFRDTTPQSVTCNLETLSENITDRQISQFEVEKSKGVILVRSDNP